MASRAGHLTRALSTTASTTVKRANLAPGMAVDTSMYTSTGGSGLDATSLSTSLQEASHKAVSAYRVALRDIPNMRRNFTIMEDSKFVASVIRDNFEQHRRVTDPKIVDMLVFKALQELREIREQWKTRTHIYSYIHRYADKVLRDEIAHKAKFVDSSDDREQMLRDWQQRGLVPNEIPSWAMFVRWKKDEDEKFHNFAVEKKLFSPDQLKRNASALSSCSIM